MMISIQFEVSLPLKIEINFILIVKSLCIPNFCSTFAAAKVNEHIKRPFLLLVFFIIHFALPDGGKKSLNARCLGPFGDAKFGHKKKTRKNAGH